MLYIGIYTAPLYFATLEPRAKSAGWLIAGGGREKDEKAHQKDDEAASRTEKMSVRTGMGMSFEIRRVC